ncbi:MAG: DUF2283 domain-containing protein [Candidatus Njordarchaeum guaymaensis]
MDKSNVTAYYDAENDILTIKLRDSNAIDTIELAEDIFALINEKGEIVELEIWRAKDLIAKTMADKIAERIRSLIKAGT